MEENIKRYHPLGSKTLFMFIFKRSFVLFVMVPLLFLLMVTINYVPVQYLDIAVNALFGYIVFLILTSAGAFFLGWLQYYRYWIFIGDKDLKIARGLIATEQIGLPFRRVQDVKIHRSLIDQLFGVSDVVITVLGEEDDEKTPHDESVIILPSVSKEIGLEIQDIVLKKAQVEQVSVLTSRVGI